jgi:hypothetical protein
MQPDDALKCLVLRLWEIKKHDAARTSTDLQSAGQGVFRCPNMPPQARDLR